jgi:hypothetical protein
MMKINVYSEKSGNFASDSKMKPMIIIESKKKPLEPGKKDKNGKPILSLKEKYPDAMIIDVTSKAQDEFVKFSPFYPIGGIPVPFTEDLVALSVEGIWQGLKVFEDNDIDTSLFSKRDMKNMKRTKRKFGLCLGHRKGVHGEELLGYLTARKQIYLPCYKWVLENKLQKLVTAIRIISKNKPVVLLDYNTNQDVWNPKSPLSHASLIKAYIEGNYPE